MRFPSLMHKTFAVAAGIVAASLLCMPVQATVIDEPLPDAIPNDAPVPLEDHTAQDGPLEDHTAQDGAEPTPTPDKKPPRLENPISPMTNRRGESAHRFDRDVDPLEVPIFDALGIELPDAPNQQDFVGGPASAQSMFDQLNFGPGSDDGFASPAPAVRSGTVPAPGALIIIGLGGLMLRRRRR